jgi:HSP20 family protein
MSTPTAVAPARVPEKAVEKPTTTPVARIQNPFELMRSLSEDMDRLFGDFVGRRRWPFSAFGTGTTEIAFTPNMEVEERQGQLYVRTDLPGLTKDNVKVEVTEDLLTIEGERKQEKETKNRGYYRSERAYGHFSRTLALPEGAKPETAKATFKDGVLEITIDVPASKPADVHRVEIANG